MLHTRIRFVAINSLVTRLPAILSPIFPGREKSRHYAFYKSIGIILSELSAVSSRTSIAIHRASPPFSFFSFSANCYPKINFIGIDGSTFPPFSFKFLSFVLDFAKHSPRESGQVVTVSSFVGMRIHILKNRFYSLLLSLLLIFENIILLKFESWDMYHSSWRIIHHFRSSKILNR